MNNDEFFYDENCPCAECRHEGACAAEKMACEDFLHYAATGNKRFKSREAQAVLYQKLFPSESGCE